MSAIFALLALSTPFVVYYIIQRITHYLDNRRYDFGIVHGSLREIHARRNKKTLEVEQLQPNGTWAHTTRIFIKTRK